MIPDGDNFAGRMVGIAFHEAAHAVAAAHLGMVVHGAAIVFQERYASAGQAFVSWEASSHEDAAVMAAAGDIGHVQGEVLMLTARGPELALKFNADLWRKISADWTTPPGESPTPRQSDAAFIVEKLETKAGGAERVTASTRKRWLRIADDRAVELLRQPAVWGPVVAIAEALLENIVLTGEEIKAIMAAAQPATPPEQLLTSREHFARNWLRPLPESLARDGMAAIAAAAVEHGAEAEFAAFLKGGGANV